MEIAKATIAQAKNNLPKLIHAVEQGDAIHLTRHGRAVAVLISSERYAQLMGEGKSIFQAILQWREQYTGVDISDEEIASWRDTQSAREFTWD